MTFFRLPMDNNIMTVTTDHRRDLSLYSMPRGNKGNVVKKLFVIGGSISLKKSGLSGGLSRHNHLPFSTLRSLAMFAASKLVLVVTRRLILSWREASSLPLKHVLKLSAAVTNISYHALQPILSRFLPHNQNKTWLPSLSLRPIRRPPS